MPVFLKLQIIPAPFPDKVAVLLFRSVADGFREWMRRSMTVCKQIVRPSAMPFWGDVFFPFGDSTHRVIALMFIRLSIPVLSAFGKQNIERSLLQGISPVSEREHGVDQIALYRVMQMLFMAESLLKCRVCTAFQIDRFVAVMEN